MKRFTGFIAFLAVIFIIIFLLCLLLPSRVTVSKSVEIDATGEAVREQITRFDHWKHWYPAFQDETAAVTQNASAPGILWSVTLGDPQGKKVTLQLTDTSQNMIDVRLLTGSSAKVSYQFILIPKTNHRTQLTWNINTDLGWYPWRRIRGLFLDKFSGDRYEAALHELKTAAEN
jgi:carbon monoxide dehydrogenase subunit G